MERKEIGRKTENVVWRKTRLRGHRCRSIAGSIESHDPTKAVLETGLYYESVKRYLGRFLRQSIRILLYENYRAELASVLTESFRFLGVDSSFKPDLSKRHNEPRVPRFIALNRLLSKPGGLNRLATLCPSGLKSRLRKLWVRPRDGIAVKPSDREFLLSYYRDDIRKLAQLLSCDLTAWLG